MATEDGCEPEAEGLAAWRMAGEEVLCEGSGGSARIFCQGSTITRRRALASLAFLVDPPRGCALRILSQVRRRQCSVSCIHACKPVVGADVGAVFWRF